MKMMFYLFQSKIQIFYLIHFVLNSCVFRRRAAGFWTICSSSFNLVNKEDQLMHMSSTSTNIKANIDAKSASIKPTLKNQGDLNTQVLNVLPFKIHA